MYMITVNKILYNFSFYNQGGSCLITVKMFLPNFEDSKKNI